MPDRLLEVCVDSTEGLAAAIEGGADRIELCTALSLGGLTPSAGLMKQAAAAPIPVFAMIRPRAGDFVFSVAEVDIMHRDIKFAREAGLAGVVLGVSNADDTLDTAALESLLTSAKNLGTTLHRAIDLAPDIEAAVDQAAMLGFERVLTSGGHPTADAGRDMLLRMHVRAAGRLSIMAGSGVTVQTASAILNAVPLHELHASCSDTVVVSDSKATRFGFTPLETKMTSARKIASLKKLIQL